jgi:aminodeoxyfutalosine synthase
MSILIQELLQDSELRPIADKVISGERLSFEEGVQLMTTQDMTTLGYLADIVRQRKNGDEAFFYINLNINPTNICVGRCQICAFRHNEEDEKAYMLDPGQMEEMVRKALPLGLNEVHVVSALNPQLGLSYYEDLCQRIKRISPSLCIHALTAVEIDFLGKLEKLPVETVLSRLKAAGLDNMPGGGAEVFAPRVRQLICKGKINAERWLEIHGIAHQLGITTNATLLYGHIETPEERVDHLLRLREQQDKSGGFSCFVPLAFHPENTALENPHLSDGNDNLRLIATARLLLDNIPHIKAIWTYLGAKMAQTALMFGADDLHGTNVNEKIVHDAGSRQADKMGQDELVRLITEAGRVPVLTNSSYQEKTILASPEVTS